MKTVKTTVSESTPQCSPECEVLIKTQVESLRISIQLANAERMVATREGEVKNLWKEIDRLMEELKKWKAGADTAWLSNKDGV